MNSEINPAHKKYYDFLFDLREAGTHNMLGSAIPLREYYPELSKKEAHDIALEWMQNFTKLNEDRKN